MVAPPRLKRAGGNWVDQDRFWNREDELALLKKALEEGTHILLIAQRRIGKTSLMREASLRMAEDFICLHVDLQKAQSPADAIVELSIATRPHATLWERSKRVFGSTLKEWIGQIESLQVSEVSVKLRSGLTEGDWQAKGDELFQGLADSDKPVILFFDEVPILINRMLKGPDYQITPERRQQTDKFMSWIRDNSIRHRGKVRIVITGSIGIEPILRQAQLSATINTFTPLNLGPWSTETAKTCLEALGREYDLGFEDGALGEIVERLGSCVPHHVQLYFGYLYEACVKGHTNMVSKELVANVYNEDMLSVRGHAELSHMEERLKIAFGHDLHPVALELLTEAATTGVLTTESAGNICAKGTTTQNSTSNPNEMAREILGILEHDGYLKKRAEGYNFVSSLLKDWWKARFGTVYVRSPKIGKGN